MKRFCGFELFSRYLHDGHCNGSHHHPQIHAGICDCKFSHNHQEI